MRLVEIIPALLTSDATRDTAVEFCNTLEKTTVVSKDSPGFIVNRIPGTYGQ